MRRRFLSGWKSSSSSGAVLKAWNFWDKREARDCLLDRVVSGEKPKHSKIIHSHWTILIKNDKLANSTNSSAAAVTPTLSCYCRRWWGWLFTGWHIRVDNSRLVCSWSAEVGAIVTDTLAGSAGSVQLLTVSKTLICLALLHQGILQLHLNHTRKHGQISNSLFDIQYTYIILLWMNTLFSLTKLSLLPAQSWAQQGQTFSASCRTLQQTVLPCVQPSYDLQKC